MLYYLFGIVLWSICVIFCCVVYLYWLWNRNMCCL